MAVICSLSLRYCRKPGPKPTSNENIRERSLPQPDAITKKQTRFTRIKGLRLSLHVSSFKRGRNMGPCARGDIYEGVSTFIVKAFNQQLPGKCRAPLVCRNSRCYSPGQKRRSKLAMAAVFRRVRPLSRTRTLLLERPAAMLPSAAMNKRRQSFG